MKSHQLFLLLTLTLLYISPASTASMKAALAGILEKCPMACDGLKELEFLLKYCSCSQSKGVFRFGKRTQIEDRYPYLY